jgi:excisionase family DNA binding protein
VGLNVVTMEEFQAALGEVVHQVREIAAALHGVEVQAAREFMTKAEAAEFLRVSLAYLEELIAAGEIPRAKLGDAQRGRVLLRVEDLREFVRRRMVGGAV